MTTVTAVVHLDFNRELREALEEILPYAESRIEDMAEDAYGGLPAHRVDARHYLAKALWRFRRAQRALKLANEAELAAPPRLMRGSGA